MDRTGLDVGAVQDQPIDVVDGFVDAARVK
ncbi:protein of unknown function (plasmid) [Paraburkholderia dioscoreae]|uniref:Uncharacterized protein n=1 Tax=Paraburkholderia dioscoreae TaxID=2604047 RepID=A0A5Q4ZQY1_9BURK|nr:protein of unknown function [Paraburkholderia dioscoreae]